ncbi:MAG: 2-oxoglutarate dehydrogenase E2 component (dihydrolipoamide succinyltransferase), partial [Bacteroidia bacterium]
MTIDIKAPTFPESVADGAIATWHKQPGEAVARDELLVDIETDKVVLEVVAPADGVLKEIVKAEGEIVLSDEVIGRFEEGASASASSGQSKAADPAAKGGDDQRISPAARKMMGENNLDAAAVTGTGKGGLITKEDVQSHLSSPKATSEPVASKAAPAPKKASL